MDIIHTFLYWFVVCLAFSFNAILLMGVYRVMQDKHDARDNKSSKRSYPSERVELFHNASGWAEEAELDAPEHFDPVKLPAFKMPEMKVETSFGSGKLGKQETPEK